MQKTARKTGQNFTKKPKDLLNQETPTNPLLEREKYVEKPKDLYGQGNQLTLLPKCSCSREFANNKKSFSEISMVLCKGGGPKIAQFCVVILESEDPRTEKDY